MISTNFKPYQINSKVQYYLKMTEKLNMHSNGFDNGITLTKIPQIF